MTMMMMMVEYWIQDILVRNLMEKIIICLESRNCSDDGDGDELSVQTEGSESSHGFATRLGRGLDIGTMKPSCRPECSREVMRCPPVLELRQLMQYQPVSQQTRNKLVHVEQY